jgi:tetratricopeptide (TPR) repeat protein
MDKTASPDALRVTAKMLAWRGLFCCELGRFETAREAADRALQILGEPLLATHDTRRGRARALRVLGNIANFSGLQAEATRCFEGSLELYRALGDDFLAAEALAFLGTTAEAEGDYARAKRRRLESLALRRKVGSNEGIVGSLISLGFIGLAQGDMEEGEGHFADGLALWPAREGRFGEVHRSLMLAAACHWRGMFCECEEYVRQVRKPLDELGPQSFRLSLGSIWLLGAAALHQRKYGEARNCGNVTEAGARDAAIFPYVGMSLFLLGSVALVDGAFGHAQDCLRETLTIYGEHGVAPLYTAGPGPGQVLAALGYAERRAGELENAREYLTEALGKALEGRDFRALLTALPLAALLLADGGSSRSEPERAVALYALASRYPFVANSQWFEDIAGKEISAVAGTLPPDVVAAAQERGRAWDLWETAAELLEGFEDVSGEHWRS